MTKKIELIDANISVDDRGELLFCNDFDMSKIKRFYHISNFKTPFVRAWHGHKFEDKYILVSKGAALVAAVKIDDWKKIISKIKVSILYLIRLNLIKFFFFSLI